MTELTVFLKSLLSSPGLSGHEAPIAHIIEEKWRPLVDEISTSPLGSLHGLRKATRGKVAPSLLVATHMDGIGMMVKEIRDGFLFLTQLGGIDTRILPGQPVTVHSDRQIQGVVQMLPDRLLEEKRAGSPPGYSTLFIDTGLASPELKRLVKPGSLVSFAQPPMELGGGYVAGHSLDNRASVAALTVCLEELRNFNLAWNIWAAATVQEETTLNGAYTSAFAIKPDIAIAIDVTFAKGPGSSDYRTFGLGKGPTIGIGSNIHPRLVTEFKEIAAEMDMPFAMEMMSRSSGTDAIALQVTAEGIPCMVLGVPIRYMHTPVEMVAETDILRTGRLLARFISKLTESSMTTLFRGGKS
jgi:tetrahedral aminopeptidase